MINNNENQAKNKKTDYIDTAQINLGLNMDTNIGNIKCFLVY